MQSRLYQTRLAQQQQMVGKYMLGEILGKGAFGMVRLGFNTSNGQTVALKKVSLEADDLASVQNEINLLKGLNHENIVKYIDSVKLEVYTALAHLVFLSTPTNLSL